MDRKSRLAIVASLVWVALAAVLILGTHGHAVASADDVQVEEASSEWQSLPAASIQADVHIKVPTSC